MKKLLLFVLLIGLSTAGWAQCSSCNKAACQSSYSGGCECHNGPCTTCGVCALICIVPCTGGGGGGDNDCDDWGDFLCQYNAQRAVAKAQAVQATMLKQSGFKSMDEMRAAWKRPAVAAELIDAMDVNGFNVLATMLRAEHYVLVEKPRSCGSNSRSGSFSLIDFKNMRKGDPTADWKAEVSKDGVRYTITDQPDENAPNRLVVGLHKWTVYRGKTVINEGTL
jgi:hypothetical protein